MGAKGNAAWVVRYRRDLCAFYAGTAAALRRSEMCIQRELFCDSVKSARREEWSRTELIMHF